MKTEANTTILTSISEMLKNMSEKEKSQFIELPY